MALMLKFQYKLNCIILDKKHYLNAVSKDTAFSIT